MLPKQQNDDNLLNELLPQKVKNYKENELYGSRSIKDDTKELKKQKLKKKLSDKENDKAAILSKYNDIANNTIIESSKTISTKVAEKQAKIKKIQQTATKPNLRSYIYGGAGALANSASSFLRNSNIDKNQGVEATADTIDVVHKGIRKLQRFNANRGKRLIKRQKRKIKKLIRKENKRTVKKAVKQLKKEKDYKAASFMHKLQKRRQMKKIVRKKLGIRIRDKLKNLIKAIRRKVMALIMNSLKVILAIFGVGLIVIPIILIFVALLFMGSGVVMGSSYEAEPQVLKDSEKSYVKKEEKLLKSLELSELKKKYGNEFEEFEVEKRGVIGHNAFMLLSYLTAVKGNYKSVEAAEAEMNTIFNEMYKIEFIKTVTYRLELKEFIDKDGHLYTKMVHVPHRKLKVVLKVKEMDKAAKKHLPDENKKNKYMELNKNKGNMPDLFEDPKFITEMGGKVDKNGKAISYGEDIGNLSAYQQRILQAISQTPPTGNNMCAAFVSNVVQNAGFARPGGNANDMYRNFCHSSDLRDLKVGMIVAVEHSPWGEAGYRYGHVGVYIGKGQIVDSVGGQKRTHSVSSWIKSNTIKNGVAKWGFIPGMQP